MARKKGARSLFEVISRDTARTGKPTRTGRQSLGVPGWFGRSEPAPPAGPQPQAAEAGKPRPPTPSEPIVSVAGRRLRISLNQVSAAVLALGVVLALCGAFYLGRRTAPAQTASPAAPPAGGQQSAGVQEAGGPPPLPRPVDLRPQKQTHTAPASLARKENYWYLVIQAGVLTQEQAEDIQAFLRQRGVQATIQRSQHMRKWIVRDLKGYSDRRSPEAVAYKAQVEELGKEYFRPGQGRLYDFLGCYYSLEQ